ncbi:MAG: hypothetical protein U0411_09560 [Thermodesulfovibrionales bacterium]
MKGIVLSEDKSLLGPPLCPAGVGIDPLMPIRIRPVHLPSIPGKKSIESFLCHFPALSSDLPVSTEGSSLFKYFSSKYAWVIVDVPVQKAK